MYSFKAFEPRRAVQVRFTAIAIAAAISALPGAVAFAQSSGLDLSQSAVTEIDGIVQRAMAEHMIPGLTLAVGRDSGVLLAHGYGWADIEDSVRVNPAHRFRTASIAKWFTATVAMQLAQDELLDLDAPIQRYCPVFPEKRWTVTSRHLLTHTAGIRHYVGGNGEPRETEDQKALLLQLQKNERFGTTVRYTDVIGPLAGFKDEPLLFEPGTRFHYSSHGYRLLGCVLQGAAGIPYRELMRTRVYEPAGMDRTVDDDSRAVIPGRVALYEVIDGAITRAPFRDVSENLPAGGQLATATDLVRFALAFGGGDLVRRETVDHMTTKQPLETLESRYGPNDVRHYGVGVIMATLANGMHVLMHSGGQSGTSSLLVFVPDHQLAVAIISNRSGVGSYLWSLASRIAAIAARDRDS